MTTPKFKLLSSSFFEELRIIRIIRIAKVKINKKIIRKFSFKSILSIDLSAGIHHNDIEYHHLKEF